MRLRNIRGSKDVIASCPFVVQEPESCRGRWAEIFGNENPIHIEVGMGKGRFLMDMAVLHPEINYVGIEMYDSVLLRAVQKREKLETEIKNLFFIRMDARQLPEVFAEGEVDRIYLNFSDPWPKDRHAKRRLTSHEFLARYEKILKKDGTLEFKTDNKDLFDFSLEEMKNKILEYLHIDYVHILINGKIIKTGDASLIKIINEQGYEPFITGQGE